MKSNKLLLLSILLLLFLNVAYADRFGNGWGTSNDFGVPPFYQIDVDDEFNTLSSVYGDLRTPVYCDIDGDNGRELIYSEGNTIIITNNATTESFNESIVYTISPYSDVLDLVCVDDSLSADDTDNKIIVVYENVNGVSAKGLKLSSGVLVDTYTYFTDLSPTDYGLQTSMTCIDYLNEQFCIYGANVSSSTNSFIRLVQNNSGVSYNHVVVNNSGTIFQLSQRSLYDMVSGEVRVNAQLFYDEYDDNLYNSIISEISTNYIFNFDSCSYLFDDCELTYASDVLVISNGAVPSNRLGFGIGALSDLVTGQVYCMPRYIQSSNSETYYKCYDGLTEVYSYTSGANYNSNAGEPFGAISVDFNGDSYKDVIFFSGEGYQIYDTKNANVLATKNLVGKFIPHSVISDNQNVYIVGYSYGADNLSLVTLDRTNTSIASITDLQDISKTDQMLIFGDVNRDSYVEVLGHSDTATTITYLTASVVVDEVDVFNTTDYQGLFGFYDQDNCVGDVVIKAKECLVGNDCNYINGNLNIYVQEKLCSDCGGTETYKCGSYSVTLPQITCSNLSVGTNNVDVDLFTETNENFPAFQFDTFEIDVFNGVEGSTCNVAGDIVTQEDADEEITGGDTTDTTGDLNDPETLIDTLLTSFFRTKSNNLKLIIGVFIIGGVLFMIHDRTKGKANGVLYGLGVIGGLIFNVAIGIFSKEIVIIGVFATAIYIFNSIRREVTNRGIN